MDKRPLKVYNVGLSLNDNAPLLVFWIPATNQKAAVKEAKRQATQDKGVDYSNATATVYID